MERGDSNAALAWLEQAHLLSRGDPCISLALAGMRAVMGREDCIELFRRVALDCDVALAWHGLASACFASGRTDDAAAAMVQALSRHALPVEMDAACLTEIATAAGSPGWCGLDGAGNLLIAPSGAREALELTLLLDGERLDLSPGCVPALMALPERWLKAKTSSVLSGEEHLIGSPVDIAKLVRVDGFVAVEDGGLAGWAWSPGRPDHPCQLRIERASDPSNFAIVEAIDENIAVANMPTFARPRRIRVSANELTRFDGLVRMRAPDGRELYGSPLDPAAPRRSAVAAVRTVARMFSATSARGEPIPLMDLPAIPATLTAAPAHGRHRPRPVDVVIPVYKGQTETLACIGSVIQSLPAWARVVVVDDCSPEPGLVQALDGLAAQGQIRLVRQARNTGFPGAANAGLWASPERDVVLLNSDTLVPGDWLGPLRRVAYSAPDIGTVTPLSNDATILSYPSVEHSNPVPDLAQTQLLGRLAKQANGLAAIDLPTGVGFCIYIRRELIDAVGGFREDIFGQGYGEENDFCMRARHLGWRHVVAPGVFVAHIGGRSFGAAKAHLIERNLKILNALHPGYDGLVHAFEKADPLAAARRRFDMARWRSASIFSGSVLLVTHGRSGGVQTRVRDRANALRAQGLRPIVMWPVQNRVSGRDCVLGDGPEGGTPNLRFNIPDDLALLSEFLGPDRPRRAEVHSLIGHDHAICGLFALLGIPYEMVVHDYSVFCPRINLVGRDRRYCGEPDTSHCEACLADTGTAIDEPISLRELRQRSERELLGADQVIVPSSDAASRLRRHFPAVRPQVTPWEGEIVPTPPERNRAISTTLVAALGAIGSEKGYDILLECARDAARRRLDLQFVLVGYSMDDKRLLDTGRVRITGRYEEVDVDAIIRAQAPNIGFATSIWPETWSYTLSQLWRAGLDVAAFDLGAPSERIRRSGRGWVMPLGLRAPAVNDALLGFARSSRIPKAKVSRWEMATAL